MNRIRSMQEAICGHDAEKEKEMRGITWSQYRSARSFLNLACLIALLMTFALPATADSPRKLDVFESDRIDDIGEFRPALAKKLRERLPKKASGRESAEYLNRQAKKLEVEIKGLKKFGKKKDLQHAIYVHAILYVMIHNQPSPKPGGYAKKFFKKTEKEVETIKYEFFRAIGEATEIREARKAAEEKKRKAAEEKKRKEAEEKKRKAAKTTGSQSQGSLSPGRNQPPSADKDPQGLLNALAGALNGLNTQQQSAVTTPYVEHVPSALEAAQQANHDRERDLATAARLDRERKRDKDNHQGYQNTMAGETGDSTGIFQAGDETETTAGGGETGTVSETGDSTGTFQTGDNSGANLGAFSNALGRYAGDGGCGFTALELIANAGLILAYANGQIPLSISGSQATGQNVTLFGVTGHHLAILLIQGALQITGSHPGGGSCTSNFHRT